MNMYCKLCHGLVEFTYEKVWRHKRWPNNIYEPSAYFCTSYGYPVEAITEDEKKVIEVAFILTHK